MGEHLLKRPAQTSPQKVQSPAPPQERHDTGAAGRSSEGLHAYLGGAWISASLRRQLVTQKEVEHR